MYNVSLISLAALGLVACSDSSQTASTPAPAAPAPTQGVTAGNAPTTDGVQGSTAPDAGIDPSTVVETPETVMDLGQAAAQKTQAEVKAGDHITASGSVSGDCSGTVRIDVIEQGMGSFTPTGNGEGTPGTSGVKGPSGPAKPLTTFELSGAGDFSVAIPKGANVMVSALCDSNGDGRIDPSMDALSRPAELGTVTDDKTGLSLQLELLTAGGMGMGMGGMDQGGMSQGGMGGMGAPGGSPGGMGQQGGMMGGQQGGMMGGQQGGMMGQQGGMAPGGAPSAPGQQ